VWQVGYLQEERLVVTGTDGGKLETFNAVTGSATNSVKAFEHSVAALKVLDLFENSNGCIKQHSCLQWKISKP
jgi:hypothetical protein